MAYLVYQKIKLPDGQHQFFNPSHVILGGGGLIQTACRQFLGSNDLGWTVSESDLLQASGFDPDAHALVIDTTPDRDFQIDMFQVVSIAGYSYESWTPIMISMEVLFNDPIKGKELIQETKSRFDDSRCSRDLVRTILYLGGGYAHGSWNWGGNSRTTAAVLWPDAWNHFMAVARNVPSLNGHPVGHQVIPIGSPDDC